MSDATKRAITVVATVFFFLCATVWAATQPEPVEQKPVGPRKDYAAEYHPALKDNTKEIPDLLIYGPDAAECVKFEAAGLHITLPAGYPVQRPGTGVVTDFGVKGDFEITLAFEVLPAADQAPPTGWASVRLVAVPHEAAVPELWHKANQNRAGLAREITGRNGAGAFFADATKWNPDVPRDKWGNEVFTNVEEHPVKKRVTTTALTGRLRLVRSGAELFFFTSEDAEKDFKPLVPKYDFGTKDLKNVRVLASTGTSSNTLDVLITDLHIRADGLVKRTAAPPPSVTQPRSLAIPIALGSAILVLLVLLLSLGAWLFLRQSGATGAAKAASGGEAAGTSVFACSHCGKKIKVNTERAGKTVKCPHCTKAVKVPITGPEEAEEVP